MPVLEVVVSAKLDGVPFDGFPVTRRIEVTEAQTLNIQKANGDAGAYVELPTVDILPVISAFILRTDAAIGLRFNAQSDAGIALNKGGLIVIIDANIASGAATNVKVNNAGAGAATLRGAVGGT